MTELCVFTDESGNTGNNLFDENQPFFWIGSFISKQSFSKDYCFSEKFHGCESDITEINEHAAKVISIIQNERCYIMVSKLCKRHHARLKFFDHIFDSGYNKAVSGIHYFLRPLRLMLAEAFSSYLSPRSEEQFWSFLKTLDLVKFVSILDRVLWNVRTKEKDKRLKELLSDAILYALKNPNEFTETNRTINDSPNIV